MGAVSGMGAVPGLAGALPAGISLTGNGGLDIAGLEWLGVRAYDPATRGFLSTDPLSPVLGAGWDGNPYAYAGNNTLNTTDPTGLRPLTDDELKAYDGSSRGAFAAAGNWINENKEYIAGGLAFVVGAALMFVPGGQIAGMGLMSFGADVVIQKATTGKVNWAQSAAIGVTGAVGGAGFAAARITMAASSAVSRIGGYVAINAGVNGAAGAVAGGGVYAAKNGGVKSWRGLAGAMVGGGVSGAIGGLAGPAGGTLARASGYAANSPAVGIIARAPALLRMTALGSGGGVAGTAADKVISGEQLQFGDVVWSAATGGGLTHLPGGPSQSSTLAQAAWTNASTLSGLRGGVNGTALIRSGVIGASVGGGFDFAKFLVTGD
jgi:RHS repeat-associated protein